MLHKVFTIFLLQIKKLRAKIIGIGLVCVLIVSITAAIIFVKPIEIAPPKKESDFKNWNRAGPFATNKFEYKIGDSIFFVADELASGDAGNIVVVMPSGNKTYLSLPFDSEKKSSFNYYFKPTVSAARHICSTNDLVGDWTVVLQGTQYKPLKFRILNETLPDEKGGFQRVC